MKITMTAKFEIQNSGDLSLADILDACVGPMKTAVIAANSQLEAEGLKLRLKLIEEGASDATE